VNRPHTMFRILVLHPSHGAYAAAESTLSQQDLPGCAIVHRALPCGISPAGSFFDAALDDLLVLEAGRHAEEERMDAVCVMTLDDGGATALRSVLDVPVLAAGKATSLHALTLGHRFAWVVEHPAQAVRLQSALRQWHFDAGCTSVRVARSDTPHALRAALVDCVEQDGAAVICLGSGALVTAAAGFAGVPGVPVLDPLAITTHMAQVLLSTGLSHSRSATPRPLVPKPDVVQGMSQALVEGWPATDHNPKEQ
jgi:allantoin racemase